MENNLNFIEYQIDTKSKEAYFIHIVISFTASVDNPTIQLSAWRPGRYMLQNYAANVRDCKALHSNGDELLVNKTDRNIWEIQTEQGAKIRFSYSYYCRQMDAGGCWSDPSLFYINPIACLMSVSDQSEIQCHVKFKLPQAFTIGTGLPLYNNVYTAQSFLELSDYPVMASKDLTTLEYSVGDIPFYIHSLVDPSYFPESFLSDFKTFTEAQIADFGSFPVAEYHFLLLILPYTHYHGVEHRNSTVICLGPSADVKEKLYTELLGICSHELLHTWNICKIRPQEMMPCNLSKENYFKTGFVAEGFTTYLGDHYLAHAHVLPLSWYESELNTLLKRHFYSFGNNHLSVADSSMDLWVDGYEAGIPGRKVSIYVKGAIIAFVMDAAIREASGNTKNIKFLLKDLWIFYTSTGKGYSEAQIEELFHSYTNKEYLEVYSDWIYGTGDMKNDLILALTYLGYRIDVVYHEIFLTGKAGILYDVNAIVQSVDPSSPYATSISKGDKLVSVNGIPIKECSEEFLQTLEECILELNNGVRKWSLLISITEARYFKTFQIGIPEDKARMLFQ
ncbi:MAG: PDZ domain-containing protein [Cytophagales bacterium]|nr:PDZ domain-containing protein [Cytophaga sp.]